MSDKEGKIEHPYSDITYFELVAGRDLTPEEMLFQDRVNERLANALEIFWSPVVAKDVMMMIRRATSFPTAAQVANDRPPLQKPVVTAQDKIPVGLSSVIGSITAETKNATVQARVLSVTETKTTSGGNKVQNLVIEDLSGKIPLVLWKEETGMFKEGDRLELEKGYVTVNDFGGNKSVQLQKGKFGRLRKL